MLARVASVALVMAACAPMRSDPPPAATRSLGGIELEMLDGGKTALSAAMAGRPTLISLWATWCETCSTEFGALARLHVKAKEQGAHVVAVDEGEPRSQVADFVKSHGLDYPQLVDEPFALGDALGARRVPTTLVLDRRGTIVFRGGTLDRDALVALDRAIAAK